MTLVLALLKLSAVLAITLAVATLGRRRSAAWRHWILASGTGCALLLPALAFVVPAWPVIASPAPAPSGVVTTATIVGVETPDRPEGTPARPSSPAFQGAANVLAGVWLAGAAAGMCSLFAGVWRLSRVASGARLVEGEWAGHICAISSMLGLQRTVRFRETTAPALLVTWGARRAEVLLPAGAASWQAQRIRVVVAHELAHVRRGDWVIQLLGELLRVVYWFHPLAWLVCGRLRQESERACDDVVLGLGIARTVYAGQLVELARTFGARRAASRPALAIAHPSTLQRRIRAMLNLQLDRRPLSLVSRLCGTLIILLAAAPIAAIGGQAGATVSGTVTDPAGRPIPGVHLTLANPSQDFKVLTTTDASGTFEVPVIAGTYQLEARHPGFAMQTQRVTLAAGDHVNQSVVLSIGSLKETITVTGGPASDAPSPRRAQRPVQQCTPSSAGGQLVPPLKIVDVRPVYPAGGTLAATQVVPLEARIDVDGAVQSVRATAPVPPELEASAVTAVRQWEFTPTLLNCEPVAVTMFVTVTFQPSR